MARKNSTIRTISGKSAGARTHPGQHVRDSILAPRKLSVLAAARLVGVGRPAFSNFLNGHVAATVDMAARIEHAFGLRAQDLLEMQSAYEAAQIKSKGAPANAVPYVAPFLDLKAVDVENWVTRNISARTRLSVLLRTLVHSTGNGLTKVDFPGNDDAQRSGWDGYVESTQATPWIPEGCSGWEFGVDAAIKGKADSDFAKSVNASAKADRDQTTFVFVSPRHWPAKAAWIAEKSAEGQWKDVRAYDSSDLEQWLQQSIPGQAWFANETLRPSDEVRSLDKCWDDWANVASPPLAASLFRSAVESAERIMTSRLAKSPGAPTVISADSTEEALAFLAQLFGPDGGKHLEEYRDRVLVFDKPGVLPKLAQGTKDFIAVTASRSVERELGSLAHSMHTIVIHPRNAANAAPDIELKPLNHEAFRASLEGMSYGRDDVARYANESGRSLTVLRRRLSTVPAVRTPVWAADHETAVSLVPFGFVGAWSSTNTADQAALVRLAEVASYSELEKKCQRFASLDDAPLWSVGTYRGVISKIDLLFAVAVSITPQDLSRYFDLARMVLSEDDPKLDLPAEERWAASLHGKSREFSSALREGVSETLVLLAVHGDHLFRTRLGFDCQLEANRLVRDLLTPLKTRILEANDRDLTAYAEAAPHEFLSILEEDLRSEQPECYGLMRPAGTGVFGDGCPRTGLLWALEGLAWNPETLLRAALILAQLAKIEIKDNWANKPISSLESIFRVWMPQTASDHASRLRVIRLLAEKFPEIAWKICLEQLNTGHKIGQYSHKPSWRNDGYGFGEPFKTREPIYAFIREMADMAVAWNGGYTSEMLCDLVQHLYDLDEIHQAKVWDLVRAWAKGAPDADKAYVREKIRVTVLSRHGVKRSKESKLSALSLSAKTAIDDLKPSDVLNLHEWLFRENWIEESADELHEDDLNYVKREARIAALRADALREVFQARGLPGVFELAEKGKAAGVIGWLMASEVLQKDELPNLLLQALPPATNSESWAKKNLIGGVLRALDDQQERSSALEEAKRNLSESDFVRLLLLAPFRRSTWQLVDELDEEHRQNYWLEVPPDLLHDSDDERVEAVERLLACRRPRAAFACVRFELELLGPELLFRLMSDVVKDGNDQPGQYQLEHYYVEKAFQILDSDPKLTLEQKAGLEFVYIGALYQPWRERASSGIPNLEKYIELHPEFFVQLVVWTYKRKDEGEDPREWKVAPEQVPQAAERGHRILDGLSRIPGHDDLGELQADRLAAWVKHVRDSCAALDRLDIADVCIGNLLSGAPVGADGVWPCEPVRQVMEDVRSNNMMRGAHTGLYNSRGVTWRGEGGDQEREVASKYRRWVNALQYSHSFLASELLLKLVKTYENEADREDAEAGIRRRLR